MKSVNFKKYVTLILFLVVTLGFTIGTHYLLKPVIDKQGIYGEVLEVNEGSVLTEQSFTKGSEEFMIYRVSGEGDYVGGGSNGKVITKIKVNSDKVIVEAEFELYEHTDGFRNPADKFIESLVTNKQNILEFTGEFEFDGSSGSTNSFKIIRESIYGLTQYLSGDEPIKPEPKVSTYEALFGKDYKLENEKVLIGGAVSKEKSIIKRFDVTVKEKLVAYTYFVERIGQRITGDSYGQDPEGAIEIQVITKVETSRILGFELDLDKYKHSTDEENLGKVLKHFEIIVDKSTLAANYNKDSYKLDGNSGASDSQGVNNTGKLIQTLLTDLSVELKKEYVFGEVSNIDVKFEIDNKVQRIVSEQTITFEEQEYKIYNLSVIGDYFFDNETGIKIGQVDTSIVINTNDIIVDAYFTRYGHTKGGFYKHSKNYLNLLINSSQNIRKYDLYNEYDDITGSTNSFFVISSSVYALRIHLTGDDIKIPNLNTTYSKLFGRFYKLDNEEIIVGGEVSLEHSIIKRYDVIVNEEVVAHTYFVERRGQKITGENYGQEPFGSIELQIIVSPVTTRILGVEIDLDKYEHSTDDIYISRVTKYFDNLVDKNVTALEYNKEIVEIDDETGATENGLSNTAKLVIQILEDLSTDLRKSMTFTSDTPINKDITVEGKVYKVVAKKTFVTTDNELTFYKVSGKGKYIDSSDNEKEIITVIVIDKNGVIVEAYFDLYEHTNSDRRPQHYLASLSYLDKLVSSNTNINSIYLGDSYDGSTGSTNSFNLVHRSIYALRLFLRDEVSIDSGSVLTKTTKVVEGKTLTSYLVLGEGKYIGNRSGKVITNITIDENNIIVAAEFELYEHTPKYKPALDEYIAKLSNGTYNILELENKNLDDKTGSTNSYNIVRESIYGLTTYLKNGNR